MWKDILKTVIKTTTDPTSSPFIHTPLPHPAKLKPFSLHRPKETLFDKITHKNIEPARGALVYCQLATAEHSGIYLGNGCIAQLNGRGDIEMVSPKNFTNHITTLDIDIFIPVHAKTREPLGAHSIACQAERVVGSKRNYHLLFDNCHQFSAGCIIGDFENPNNFLIWTKGAFADKVGKKVDWVRWKWYSSSSI